MFSTSLPYPSLAAIEPVQDQHELGLAEQVGQQVISIIFYYFYLFPVPTSHILENLMLIMVLVIKYLNFPSL